MHARYTKTRLKVPTLASLEENQVFRLKYKDKCYCAFVTTNKIKKRVRVVSCCNSCMKHLMYLSSKARRNYLRTGISKTIKWTDEVRLLPCTPITVQKFK